ncbi:MAG: hypothetical protein PUH30_12395 [Oscillospiraceae bacterium]|nr:hypothetical protein [Oscillospiraceae bacterium]
MSKKKRYILFKDISLNELIRKLLKYRFKKYKEISIEKNNKGIEIIIEE